MNRVRIKMETDKFIKNNRRRFRKNMESTSRWVVGQVKKKISRGNKGGGSPSAAGEPPKVVTGRLRSSITHEIDRKGLRAYVGSNLPYALELEYGTRRMEPRPFLRPTVLENKRKILKRLTK